MTWKDGPRRPKKYADKQDSFDDFKDIWHRLYGRFPTIEDAERWTGKDNAQRWLEIVTEVYNRPKE